MLVTDMHMVVFLQHEMGRANGMFQTGEAGL